MPRRGSLPIEFHSRGLTEEILVRRLFRIVESRFKEIRGIQALANLRSYWLIWAERSKGRNRVPGIQGWLEP